MMSAAAVTTRAACWKPCTTEPRGFAGLHELLAHARDEEHLVVHREAEQHGHEQDRQEAQDRAGLDVQELGRTSPTGTPRRSTPMRRERREQEAERRLDRHEDRPEHEQQQHDRQPDDDERERHERVVQPVRDVDRDGGRSRSPRWACRTPPRSAAARSRISCTSCFVSGSFGALSGITWMIAVSTVSFGQPVAHVDDAVELGEACADRVEVVEDVGGLRDVDRDDERAVVARARTRRRSCRRPRARRCLPAAVAPLGRFRSRLAPGSRAAPSRPTTTHERTRRAP